MSVFKRIFTRVYKRPTPMFYKILGDSILFSCSLTSIDMISRDNHHAGIVFIIVGGIGKFLSSYPVEAKKQ